MARLGMGIREYPVARTYDCEPHVRSAIASTPGEGIRQIMIGDILQISFVLIMAYLIIANAPNFATAVGAAGSTYVNAVKVLQGR